MSLGTRVMLKTCTSIIIYDMRRLLYIPVQCLLHVLDYAGGYIVKTFNHTRKATCMSIVRASTRFIQFVLDTKMGCGHLSYIPKWGVVICLGYRNRVWSVVQTTTCSSYKTQKMRYHADLHSKNCLKRAVVCGC